LDFEPSLNQSLYLRSVAALPQHFLSSGKLRKLNLISSGFMQSAYIDVLSDSWQGAQKHKRKQALKGFTK
jgi:hypothetical protein